MMVRLPIHNWRFRETLFTGQPPGGGAWDSGTLFALAADGSSYTNFYSFTGGSDGSRPVGVTVQSNVLYGAVEVAPNGGGAKYGAMFKMNIDGSGFTPLHLFSAGTDEAGPISPPVLSGGKLYGTTIGTQTSEFGTVFTVNTDGTDFRNLYSFTNGDDGSFPAVGAVIPLGSTLYGLATHGGRFHQGTLYSISLRPPPLEITASVAGLVLSWPRNATPLTLQSSTSLGPSAVWTAVPGVLALFNGKSAITNPISSTQRFYRLTQ